MAAGMVKHGKRHAARVLLLMALWYHPAFSRERNLPVIPYPAEVRMDGRGVYDMERSSWWIDPEADSLCVKAVERFFAGVAHDGPSRVRDREDASVLFLDDRDLPQGHYAIDVSEDGITVKSSGLHGLNYACQTLRQMYPDIPCCRIRDFPRFRYRGMHLDVSRHFFSVREVKRYIDIMELHKMNILHWHLTDDQGWRVEIRKYPLLTEKGAFRKGTCIGDDLYSDDGIPYGGFYSQDEIREVVSYAAERGISVMPEIDMPGHMLAALASYPWLGCTGGPYEVWGRWGISDDVLCPGKESTFAFVKDVLDEIMELFPCRYIHIGGDECPKSRWKACPDCQRLILESGIKSGGGITAEQYLQAMFMRRVEEYLISRGRRAVAWDEILEGGEDTDAVVMSWRGEAGGRKAALLGRDAVMVPEEYMYFDYMQGLDEDEPGASRLLPIKKVYGYEPVPEGLDDNEADHILGLQANLWTERVPDAPTLEYMLLPRIDALSEVQWCSVKNRDYGRFLKNIGNMLGLYREMGYRYCPHVEGIDASVSKSGDCFHITLSTSGDTPVFYSLDGNAFRRYTSPVKILRPCVFNAYAERSDSIYVKDIVFQENKAFAKKIIFNVPPSPLYTFNADETLTDGIAGDRHYPGSGGWAGWQGLMDVTVDMGKGSPGYSSVTMSFYVGKAGHYFPPVAINVQVSGDGRTFRTVSGETFPVEPEDAPDGIKVFRLDFPRTTARFVRVKSESPRLPEWHPARGYFSFILTDEILIL